jgi:hypothetical protein
MMMTLNLGIEEIVLLVTTEVEEEVTSPIRIKEIMNI